MRRNRKLALMASTAIAAPAVLYFPIAYANTLTRLIPDIYAALDVVSRELVGFIPSVARNASAERAAKGESVVWPVAPSLVAVDTVPAMQIPTPADITIGNGAMTITKSKNVPVGWAGEEQRGLNNGVGYLTIQADLIAQGLRTLVNEIETDLAVEAANNGSRAYGTPGTTPFAGDKMTDAAQTRKILDDNGAPLTGRSLIINTSAGANLRSMYNLTRANEAATNMTLRDGELLNLMAFSIKESAGVDNAKHTAGTGDSATTNTAGYAKGATSITLAATGTGTIVVGDTISFAGDANKYQVVTGAAAVSGATIEIAAPGLREAIPAAATAITVAASAAHNIGFSPDALRLAARAPAMPVEGDARLDSRVVVDPRSGLAFEFSIWPGHRMVRLEIAIAWGVKAVKREHIAVLLGEE